MFVFAVRGAGMFALTTTTLLRNAKVLPGAAAIAAYVLAAFLLLAVTKNPVAVLVFPAWVVLISVFLLRHARRVAVARHRRTPRHHPPEPEERPVMTAETTPAASRTLEDIPGPKGVPVLGNMFDVKNATLIQDLMQARRANGGRSSSWTPPPGRASSTSGLEMVDDLCDDTRFDKLVGLSQREFRKTHKSAGLFTADTDDPLWKSAHDILLPSFSTWAMKGYLDPMIDIAEQLCQKWERLNPDEPIDVVGDMTRLTLDTIALCGFSYRFNSFYRDSQHPFVEAMMGALHETQARQRLLPVAIKMRRGAQRKLMADSKYMDDTVATILTERKASGDPGNDLLGHMLVGTDKQGNSLPDHNIVAQCVTFLVAGHETTSGLLSFAISYLLKNPEVVARAQEEVDRVLGTDPSVPPTVAQVQQLGYIRQILDETLRLWPTAPAFTRQARATTTVGGWGPFSPGQSIIALTPMLHRLPEIWGPDAEEFNPDHFDPARRDALPPNAFRPFGSGQRACIGRQFALQEATLVLGMLMQRFEFIDHANYQLKIKESLTLKPDGLTIKIRPRAGRTWGATQRPVAAAANPRTPALAVAPTDRHGTPLLVLFGSNLGASEDLATRIARDATDRGYTARTAGLDDAVGELPTDGAVVVVTSSYNGQPPDNAGKFCAWADDAASSATGVRYTVFGCGNRDWAATYQAVPTRIDADLEARGGDAGVPARRGRRPRRLRRPVRGLVRRALGRPRVRARAGRRDDGGGRERPAAGDRARAAPHGEPDPAVLPRPGRDRAGQPGAHRPRGHRGRTLGAAHRDHAARGPRPTPRATTSGCCRATTSPWSTGCSPASAWTGASTSRSPPTGAAPTHLPVGEPYPLLGILAGCVELQDVASRAGLTAMAAHMPEGPARDELAGLAATDDEAKARYREKIAVPRRTLLDLLEEHPECELPFAEFLDLLPPLRPRYYSISSSPTASSDVVGDGRRARGSGAARRRLDVPRRLLGAPQRGSRRRHRVHLRPAAEHRLPAAGEPARSDDHGGRGHGDGPVPRVPAGAGVAAGPGRPDRHVAAVPRLPRPARTTCSTPTSSRPTRPTGSRR